MIVIKNYWFFKEIVLKTTIVRKLIVFIKFILLLTILNNNPSLMIINNDPSLMIINDNPLLTIVNNQLL